MKYMSSLLPALFIFFGLPAQSNLSPGGVRRPELWFQTVPQGSDLQGRYSWQDFSGDSVKLRNYDSRGANYGTEYTIPHAYIRNYNFNPAMDLTEIIGNKQFMLSKGNLSQATIISVWAPDYGDFDDDMFLYALNGRAGDGYIFTKDKIIHSEQSGKGIFDYGKDEGKDLLYRKTDVEPSVNKFRERSLRIAAYNRVLKPNNSAWGESSQATFSIGGVFNASYPVNTSAFNTSALKNRYFYGYTPEFIVYSRILTPVERRKVETYLALKYGLSLEASYISSGDALLWDMEANKGYNTRITGYGRDGLSGLYQKVSTTSYEEAPYYSESYGTLYDSYDLNNNYNLPNRYRLLVMGRQPASPVADGKYVLFGDNDASLSTSAEPWISGIRLMSRRWLLTTNMLPAGDQEKKLEWEVQGLDTYSEGFKTKATKKGSSPGLTGSLVTQTPLLEKDGYFSWTITSTRRGPVTVKFGANNPDPVSGSHDYGYYISYSGLVYKIIRGVRQTTAIETVYADQKIEVGKEGNTVYLRVNGTRTYSRGIGVDAADSSKVFYGSIQIGKYNNDDIVLSDIRHGGFCDTGNQLELSHIAERAYEFRPYRDGGKTYLVIDRSGSGDFSPGNVEYIPSDELDATRYKTIFNNVFWDTDGNGRDVFTFGYRQSNLVAAVRQENPSCENDVPQANGQIHIKVEQGFKPFTYSLADKETKEVRSGSFFDDSLSISNLPAGTYDLSLSEAGGFNLYPKQSGSYVNKAVASTYFSSTNNAWLEWSVPGGTQAKVGMKTSSTLQSAPENLSAGYGLYCNNGQLYSIEGGELSSVPLSAVQPGDRIRVERTGSNIQYKLNGAVLYSAVIPTADRLVYNYAVAEVISGGIYNLEWNKMAGTASWKVTDNMVLENSSGDSFQQTVTLLLPECGQMQGPPTGTAFVEESRVQQEQEKRMTIHYKDASMREITAKVTLGQPGSVSLMLFDINGRRIQVIEISSGTTTAMADIRLPGSGVYVLKAFTSEGEYSAKVLSK
jgi:hypothetical protein